MNILLVTTGLNCGGAERQVVSLADEYASQGHKVAIVSLAGISSLLPEQAEIPIFELNMNKTPWGILGALLKLRGIVKSFEPDVIHSHMFHANIFCRFLRFICARQKIISTAHNSNEGNFFRMVLYRITDSLCNISTNVSRDSVLCFETRHAVPPGRMISVPNGINTETFKFDAGARDRIRCEARIEGELILAVGRLTEAKDFYNLLTAFSIVKQKVIFAKLWIAGTGPLLKDLTDYSLSLGLQDSVVFLGVRTDIPQLMSAADLFVLSSEWEGLPLVVGEAMACGTPLVVTNAGGTAELVGDLALIVPIKSPQALADAICQTLSKNAGESNRDHLRQHIVENFSLPFIAEKWIRLYQSAM